MRRVVEDRAIPKTGGSYKPVTKKPPSERTRAAGVSPNTFNPRHRRGRPPRTQNMQNEPNLLLPLRPTDPKNAKRTQFPHTKCPATPYLCETNPIRVYQVSSHPLFPQNKPNLSRSGPVEHKKCETKPHQIERTPRAGHLYLTPVFQPGMLHDPKMQNEPNLIPAAPRFRKTYPISPTADLWRTKNAKRTQSRPPIAWCLLPVSAKRTQFAALRCLFDFLLSTFTSLAGNSPRRGFYPMYFSAISLGKCLRTGRRGV